MIGRTFWYLSLATIGTVTAFLQLDRQAATSPELAALVPEPFRAVSQAQTTAASLAGNDPAVALQEAERLVLRRPVPAQSLRLLALAQFRAGEVEKGSLSIQYAAKRGWRDVAAQEAMARLAMGSGDTAEAARRFSALLVRRDTPDALLEELGAGIFGGGDVEAVAAMAGIVAGSDRWSDAFLRRGSRVMPAEAFGMVVADSIARGAEFDCRSLGRIAAAFEKRDRIAGSRLSAAAEACSGEAQAS